MHITQRQPSKFVSRFAIANEMEFRIVDGNNVIEVKKQAENLVNKCRNYNGPALLEAITYRWYGHVDWREDIDVGVNRSKEDLINWKKRCPIKRYLEGLINEKILTKEEFEKMTFDTDEIINKEWELALSDDETDPSDLLKNVYSNL